MDECITCGKRFTASPEDRIPVCPECQLGPWGNVRVRRTPTPTNPPIASGIVTDDGFYTLSVLVDGCKLVEAGTPFLPDRVLIGIVEKPRPDDVLCLVVLTPESAARLGAALIRAADYVAAQALLKHIKH